MRILSLAALRGPDLETLHTLGEVELDPWNGYVPIKLHSADDLIVDVDEATRAGVPVVHAPGRNANAVADLTVGLIFTLTRGIVAADDDVRAGRWIVDERIAYQRYRGREIRSLTIGLVGFGSVGRATAERLIALGARVLAADPYIDGAVIRAAGVEPVDLPT